ncbi:hypothetical protein [Haloechinothrix salitolerans]|uniref:Rho termination factor, N-terminal domain n=1 Tax=Haloechinothrix salitolerans TaxID=926830 RepID=A0ABW2C2A7_9PSEU
MTPETDPARMSRSELVREAHELGMSHLEHLHIEELIEAVTESREGIGAGLVSEPTRSGMRTQ